jgi:hypothetical protein
VKIGATAGKWWLLGRPPKAGDDGSEWAAVSEQERGPIFKKLMK